MPSPTTCASSFVARSSTTLTCPTEGLWKDDCLQHPALECRLDGSMGHILLEDAIPPRVIIRWFLLQENSRWQIVFANNAVCLEQSILCSLAGQAMWLAGHWGGLQTSEPWCRLCLRACVGVQTSTPGITLHLLLPPALPIKMGSCKT